jgi:hypothetical protein
MKAIILLILTTAIVVFICSQHKQVSYDEYIAKKEKNLIDEIQKKKYLLK